MVAAVDFTIPINNVSAQEKGVKGVLNFPLIELASISRRVVLVRLPYQMIYSVYGKLPQNREIRPPLGLLYVAGALEQAGHKVHIIDAEPQMLALDVIFQNILALSPEFVGLTATTPEIHGVEELCRMIKTHHHNIITIVGGAHISAVPRETLENCPQIDYAVVGEGELSAVHVVNNLPQERIIRSKDIDCVDDVPLPARHLINYEWYKYPWPGKGLVNMDVLESIRGCPFMCTFCSVRGAKPRARDVVKVVDEIEDSYKKYGTKLFMFFDDTLTVNQQHVFNLCDEIIKRGLNKKLVFYANTRANTTTPEMLNKLIEAGVTEMSMGVETGSDEMMKAIRKGCTTQQYKQVYQWMYQKGLQTRASFIVGLPYETHETVRQTIDFSKKIDLMRCSVNILTPYPGTQTYKQAMAHDGLHLICSDWKDFKRWGTSVVRTDDLTVEDLEWYQKRFLTEFYSQPKVLWYHLKQILIGNWSFYFYRPVLFAIKNRIKGFITHSRPPTWRNYLERNKNGIVIGGEIKSRIQDIRVSENIPTGLEHDIVPMHSKPMEIRRKV